jgi:chromosome segregation ATPase
MGLIDLLQSAGGRLGILETSPEVRNGECPKVQTRTVTLSELKSEIRAEEVQALAELPAELALSFNKIFAAAGVRPGVSWNIEKLRGILQSDAFRNLDREAAQARLLSLLASEKIDAEDLVKEAMAQDQALDAFETFVIKKVEAHTAGAQRQIAELEEKIRGLQTECTCLAEHIRVDKNQLRDWCKRKRAYERELAASIGYLTDRPVITTDEN